MSTARSKGQPAIGSAPWTQNEREQASQFIDQEVEEFSYSARNEMEWLNEHMAEIFSQNQRNFADVFKTPGKLRGKTPRTARKNDPQRAPLTDLFAPNPQAIMSPAQRTPFYNKIAKFSVAEDKDSEKEQPQQDTNRRSPTRVGKANADSGYHGMTEDEVDADMDEEDEDVITEQVQIENTTHAKEVADRALADGKNLLQPPSRPTEDSFVSAQDGLSSQKPSMDNLREDVSEKEMVAEEDVDMDDEAQVEATLKPGDDVMTEMVVNEDDQIADAEDDLEPEVEPEHDISSVSDASSPEKPLLRKSSLNFAALPPRETLTGKRSLGPRASQLNMQQGPVMSGALKDTADIDVATDFIDTKTNDDPVESATAEYNKTTTQRLHDRINMLGQTKEPRPSKSIPQGYPRLPNLQALQKETEVPSVEAEKEDDDDDWIAPIDSRPGTADTSIANLQDEEPAPTQLKVPTEAPKPIIGHQKSISTTNIPSPTRSALAPELRHQKSFSVSSHLNGAPALQAATPISSPSGRRFQDAPLSASKSKLYSVLKSAKNIFASSAGASAQAKMDAMGSPVAKQSKYTVMSNEPDLSKMPGGFGEDLVQVSTASSRPFSIISASPSRKTRSSTESDKRKDKETREKQRVADDLDKVREKERKKAAEQKLEREKVERDEAARVERENAEALEQAEFQQSTSEEPPAAEESSNAGARSIVPPGKLRAPTRLGRPTRQPAQALAKPVPVNIRVASQSQRMGSVQPAATSATADSAPTPSSTRQQAAAAARGATGRAGSAQPSNARVKALEAAARKKEQEDKAAERKLEQKREFERKRAAKAEEERRAEQERKVAEQQRMQEVRLAAQKQAEQRKLELQRKEIAAQKAKADAELATALDRERAQAVQPPRGDVQGTLRQLGKSTTTQDPPVNQAKPVKRPLQQDDGDAPQRPGMPRGPPSYQQQESKRRKTNEDEEFEMDARHSVMAPPKRPSNMRKETLSKFPHGYSHAPPPAAHHTQNMYKATVSAQHQLQHASKAPMHPNDTIKLSTARIPFAENANPAAPPSHYYPQPPTASSSSTATFKTPARPVQNHHHLTSAKTRSSPHYPNGENIALPEINTDSEDESDDSDSENATGGFRAPSWVASPALRDLLTQQQLVDPESVFGPIAPLHMDEVFRNSKNAERLKRFRERGESALWVESGDAVTSAEKKRDREMRARVVKEGGWTFTKD